MWWLIYTNFSAEGQKCYRSTETLYYKSARNIIINDVLCQNVEMFVSLLIIVHPIHLILWSNFWIQGRLYIQLHHILQTKPHAYFPFLENLKSSCLVVFASPDKSRQALQNLHHWPHLFTLYFKKYRQYWTNKHYIH